MTWTIAALYRFVSIPDPLALRQELRALCEAHRAYGTLLIAPEGINGTVAAEEEGDLHAVVDALDRLVGIRQGEVKFSFAAKRPFRRMKVRLRPEIITMRAPEADPTVAVGTYVRPDAWNEIISDPDVLVLDTRNRYETRIGTFRGAVDPEIDSFTEFKDFVARELDPERHRKVAMFCTGGIRCEKASSYMLAHGFEQVFHLKGGILQYLEDVPNEQSLWDGDCFVFDGRVAVGPSLKPNGWTSCFGCGSALEPGDMEATTFEIGVSCPHCIADLDEDRAAALRARHRQFDGI